MESRQRRAGGAGRGSPPAPACGLAGRLACDLTEFSLRKAAGASSGSSSANAKLPTCWAVWFPAATEARRGHSGCGAFSAGETKAAWAEACGGRRGGHRCPGSPRGEQGRAVFCSTIFLWSKRSSQRLKPEKSLAARRMANTF